MNDDAEVTSSPVVATVHDHLLGAIYDGTLQPGDRLSDGELAERFGVSRTPVREAIQRLRDLGVIEASANRFTRVAQVTPQQTINAMAVWIALYRVLVEEVIATLPDETIDAMDHDHREFDSLLETGDFAAIARANFDFYARLRDHSRNEVLVRSVTGVVYMIRLGSLHLPEAIDLPQLSRRQSELLDALRTRDVDAAIVAIETLRGIRIPEA